MDKELQKEILRNVDRKEGKTPLILLIMAVFFMASVLPPIRGIFAGGDGFWDGLTRFFLGIAFLYMAMLVLERQHMASNFRELIEANDAVLRSLYGEDYKKKKAVQLLVDTLTTSNLEARKKVHEQLVRLTGQDLPPEHKPWAAWWHENKDRIRFGP